MPMDPRSDRRSSMRRTQRRLVVAACAAALAAGLVTLASAEDVAKPGTEVPPPWFTAALEEMKTTKGPGVVIVMPATKDARETLRAQLEALVKDAHVPAQIHLLEASYVVVDGKWVQAKDGENVVVFGGDGKRVAGGNVTFTQAAFVDGIRPLLRQGSVFADRVKAARTPELEKALADLASADENKAGAAVERVASDFATFGPALIDVYEREKPGSVLQARVTWAISRAFGRRR